MNITTFIRDIKLCFPLYISYCNTQLNFFTNIQQNKMKLFIGYINVSFWHFHIVTGCLLESYGILKFACQVYVNKY